MTGVQTCALPISISISKPDYVMPLATGLTAHMFGIAGGISITQAANLIQKKDFLELLNLTNLSAVGWTREPITVRGDDTFDIGLNHPVNPNKTFAQISGLGDQQLDAAAVSLLDPVGDRGDFVSMDIKALKKENFQNGVGTIRLGQISSRATQGSFYIFTALFDRSQIQNSSSRWVVGSVKPASSRGVSFHRFLNPMRSLGVSQNNREYRFSNPSGAISADLLLIQIVSEKKNAETSGKTRRVLWSAISRGTGERVQLPDLGIPVLPQPDSSKEEKFHWEITAIKTSASRKERFNLQRALKDLQDVSKIGRAHV